MQVSVIIINYNTFDITCQCIRSVIDQTRDISYEIILVDNASTECDPLIFKKNFPSVQLVTSLENLGFAGGNNLGIRHAKGDYILLLNSDAILKENSIRFIYDKCNNISNLGAAGVKLIYPDGSIQHSAQNFPSVTVHFLYTTKLHRIFRKYFEKKAGSKNYSEDFSCDWIWGTFFFFPSRNLKFFNGQLPVSYFMYSEDVEWCYKFKKHGLVNLYFSGTGIIHLMGKSSTASFQKKLISQNHLRFIRKEYGLFEYYAERVLTAIDKFTNRFQTRLRNSEKERLPQSSATSGNSNINSRIKNIVHALSGND